MIGGAKTLSSRLGFRQGRANSTSVLTDTPVVARGLNKKALGNDASLIEPRTSTNTSTAASETSAQDSLSPADLQESRSATAAVGTSSTAVAFVGVEASAAAPVIFKEGEHFSAGGRALGLTLSPVKNGGAGAVARGARIDERHGTEGEAAGSRRGWAATATHGTKRETSLSPGDLVTSIDGRDARRLPFAEAVDLLTTPTPDMITTMASNTRKLADGCGIGNGGSSHSDPHLDGGSATKKLRRARALSAASVGPRTPGSTTSTITAPPSNNPSLARTPMPGTPRSPLEGTDAHFSPVNRSSSLRRFASVSVKSKNRSRSPRVGSFVPLLTDVRLVSSRRRRSLSTSHRGGGGGGEGKEEKGKGRGTERSNRAASVAASAFFSSPAATPAATPQVSSSSAAGATRKGALNPWGGDTPGGKPKPSRFSRARSMFRLGTPFRNRLSSPRAARSVRVKYPRATAGAGADGGGHGAHFLAAPATPPAGAATPPSPSGSSPLNTGYEASLSAGREERKGSKLRLSFGFAEQPEEIEEGDEEKDEEEEDQGNERRRRPSRKSLMSAAADFPDTESEDDDSDNDEHRGRCMRGGGEEGDVVGAGARSGKVGACSSQVAKDGSIPLREREEEEIVALSSYLACAGRGWPWTGKRVLWAEYVSLNGHHRWIRAENCRHALLVVQGEMYLLELPVVAVARHQATGVPMSVKGSWYMQLRTSDLSHVSVPFATAELGQTAHAGQFDEGSGLVLHKKGGVGEDANHAKCAWVECRNAASRDALADLMIDWVETEEKGKRLRVEQRSVAELSVGFGGGGRIGRKVPSLTDERQACPVW